LSRQKLKPIFYKKRLKFNRLWHACLEKAIKDDILAKLQDTGSQNKKITKDKLDKIFKLIKES
jgi:hypothetical protein